MFARPLEIATGFHNFLHPLYRESSLVNQPFYTGINIHVIILIIPQYHLKHSFSRGEAVLQKRIATRPNDGDLRGRANTDRMENPDENNSYELWSFSEDHYSTEEQFVEFDPRSDKSESDVASTDYCDTQGQALPSVHTESWTLIGRFPDFSGAVMSRDDFEGVTYRDHGRRPKKSGLTKLYKCASHLRCTHYMKIDIPNAPELSLLWSSAHAEGVAEASSFGIIFAMRKEGEELLLAGSGASRVRAVMLQRHASTARDFTAIPGIKQLENRNAYLARTLLRRSSVVACSKSENEWLCESPVCS